MEGEIVTAVTTGFVIVTTEALEDAVVPLVNWERCKGRSVHIKTVESIETGYTGEDRAQKIRNFLRDKLATWSIVYVMLIGDHDTVPMCPAYKAGPCTWGDPEICWEVADYVPTDYYYAELSLPDSQSWDSHDTETTPTRGEQGLDLVQFPNEVNVGRLPLNNPVEVEAVCRKMAEYEYSSDSGYKFRYLFASSYYWADTDSAVTSEYLINHDIVPTQIPPVRIYEQDPACYDSSYASQYDMSTTIVKQVWGDQYGDGYFGFVNLMGHGNPSCQGYRVRASQSGTVPGREPVLPVGPSCPERLLSRHGLRQRLFNRRDRGGQQPAPPAAASAVGFIGPNACRPGAGGWVDPSSARLNR